jgi:hypothetical protein
MVNAMPINPGLIRAPRGDHKCAESYRMQERTARVTVVRAKQQRTKGLRTWRERVERGTRYQREGGREGGRAGPCGGSWTKPVGPPAARRVHHEVEPHLASASSNYRRI